MNKRIEKVICSLIFFVSLTAQANAQPQLLITEVYYDPPGTESSNECMEIFNPNSFPINLSGWKIGDDQEKGTGTNEGMYKFPIGAVIPPNATITIALKATGFRTLFGKNPDFETTSNTDSDVPNMIKYDSWSTGSIALDNTNGDELLLIGPSDIVVDVVTYKNGSYTGVTSHPGVSEGKSIQREPPYQDTNNCSLDFIGATPTLTTLRNILVSPNAGTVGTIVTITGQGFYATEGIVIDFGTTSPIATTTADVTGSFSTTFTATLQPKWGTVTVSAKGLNSQAKVTTEFELIAIPSIKFTKSVTPTIPVSPGGTLTYTLNYTNEGSGTATNVLLTDAIPPGTTYITDTAKGDNTTISYSHNGGINYDSSQDLPVTHVKWELTVNIAPGGSGNASFDVKVE